MTQLNLETVIHLIYINFIDPKEYIFIGPPHPVKDEEPSRDSANDLKIRLVTDHNLTYAQIDHMTGQPISQNND